MKIGEFLIKSCRLGLYHRKNFLHYNCVVTCVTQEMYRDERRGRGYRGRGNRGQGHWGRGGQRRYYHEDNSSDEPNEKRYERFNRQRGGKRGRDRSDYTEVENGDESQRADRRPPGLRGKEIGLWYMRRSRERKKEMEKNMRPEVKMVHHQQQNIRQLLHEVKSNRDCPPQPERSGAELPPESLEDEDVKWFDIKVKQELPDEADGSSVKNIDGASCSSYIVKNEPDGMKADYSEIPDLEDMKDFLDENNYIVKEEDGMVSMPYSSVTVDHKLDKLLLEKFRERQKNPLYQEMRKVREKLPIYKERQKILDMIWENQVIVLSGQTGCGKTTQVPQYILDHYLEQERGSECRIICTQPRRISAVSVAERVAEERAESCGNSVGYKIRVEQKIPRAEGSILYCTSGILLKILENDPLLEKVTHVFLDEIHERDLHSDLLLIVMKGILEKRPEIKLILMSATLNAEDFSEYFNNCPMVHAKGFTYPVKEYLLEDVIEILRYEVPQEMMMTSRPRKKWYKKSKEVVTEEEEMRDVWLRNLDDRFSDSTRDALYEMDLTKIDLNLIKELIRHIITSKPEGAILVFLPGMSFIKDLNKLLTEDQFFTYSGCNIIPLHSLMPTAKEVFHRPPEGQRKIVIATNIAETSITIDDVVYVIDCGKTKLTGFMPENDLATLNTVLCSHANAKQRRGRTGRTQPGVCYHLYTSLQESLMVDQHPPEILRTRLEELCLTIKCLNLGQIMPFVKKAMQPPPIESVELAIVKLQNLNALDKDENLLPLGRLLAQIPLDPLTGKMILFGAIFGCLDPIITVAACLGFKDPFLIPMGKEKLADEAKLRLADGSLSDHILLVNAFRRWERARKFGGEHQLCWNHFMSNSTLILIEKIRHQLTSMLFGLGFLTSEDPAQRSANQNSGNTALVKAIVSAGLYPNVAKIKSLPKKHRNMRFTVKDGGKCELHPKSVVCAVKSPRTQWVVYHKKMKTTSVFLYDCTLVSPYSLLFFGGDLKHIYEDDEGMVCVDDWIKFKASPDVVSLVKELRHELDFVLDGLIKERSTNLDCKSEKGAIIKAIIGLVTTEAEENDVRNQQR